MVFVSFTSAYIVRQGLPTLDPRDEHTDSRLVSRYPLPVLLFFNTGLLLVSSVTMELGSPPSRALDYTDACRFHSQCFRRS